MRDAVGAEGVKSQGHAGNGKQNCNTVRKDEQEGFVGVYVMCGGEGDFCCR